MTTLNVGLSLSDEALEALAQALAPRVAEINGAERGDVREFLTVPEAAELLRCEPQRIYELTSDGRLPKVKDGGRVLIRRRDVDVYLGVVESLAPALQRRRLRSA